MSSWVVTERLGLALSPAAEPVLPTAATPAYCSTDAAGKDAAGVNEIVTWVEAATFRALQISTRRCVAALVTPTRKA